MLNVNVTYSDFLDGAVGEVNFELLEDKILNLKYNEDDLSLVIKISDKITENMELHGSLDFNGINVLIKALSVIRERIKLAEINKKKGM